MNKRISDWMNDAAEDIELADTELFDAGRVAARVTEKLHAEKTTVRPRRVWRTVLIAAVIVSVLAAMTAAAAAGGARNVVDGVKSFFGKTEIYEPGAGEIYVETGTGENQGHSWPRDDVAMILRFHAEKTTRQTLVHANWLPGMPTYCYPFAEYVNERLPGLDTWVEYTEAPIAQEDYAGLLGLSEEEYKNWDVGSFYQTTKDGIVWQVQLYNGSRLYGRDMTIGQYGGDATVEREWMNGDFSCMEISLDYSSSRDERVAARGVYHYLLMFNEAEGYLVNVCGKADFETLEKIADNLEFHITNVELTAPEPQDGVWAYELLDAAQG